MEPQAEPDKIVYYKRRKTQFTYPVPLVDIELVTPLTDVEKKKFSDGRGQSNRCGNHTYN